MFTWTGQISGFVDILPQIRKSGPRVVRVIDVQKLAIGKGFPQPGVSPLLAFLHFHQRIHSLIPKHVREFVNFVSNVDKLKLSGLFCRRVWSWRRIWRQELHRGLTPPSTIRTTASAIPSTGELAAHWLGSVSCQYALEILYPLGSWTKRPLPSGWLSYQTRHHRTVHTDTGFVPPAARTKHC